MLRYAVLLALILVSGVASRASPRERRMLPMVDAGSLPPLPPECNTTRFPEQCEQTPLEISFVVDASSSIGKVNFIRCLNFLEDFVGHFVIAPDKVRVSMITFAGVADVKNAFGFTNFTDKESLKLAISKTHYTAYGYTNTAGGLWYFLENQAPEAREHVRHLVIVITDGQSQDTMNTKAAAAALHTHAKNRTDMEVYAVGVGRGVDYKELTTIAGEGRNVFEVEKYEFLESLLERLIYMSCKVVTFPACQMDPVELAFVIDASSSIGKENFTAGIEFVKSFVENFKIDQTHVRLAAITYDENENEDEAIQFDDYINGQGLMRKLEALNYTRRTYTNTGAGIKYMKDTLMKKARNNTGRVCVVITDGNSQETQKTKDEAEAARRANITMYAIGVGRGVQTEELKNIAGDDSRALRVDDYTQLNTIKQTLLNVTCESALKHIAAHGRNQSMHYGLPPATTSPPIVPL